MWHYWPDNGLSRGRWNFNCKNFLRWFTNYHTLRVSITFDLSNTQQRKTQNQSEPKQKIKNMKDYLNVKVRKTNTFTRNWVSKGNIVIFVTCQWRQYRKRYLNTVLFYSFSFLYNHPGVLHYLRSPKTSTILTLCLRFNTCGQLHYPGPFSITFYPQRRKRCRNKFPFPVHRHYWHCLRLVYKSSCDIENLSTRSLIKVLCLPSLTGVVTTLVEIRKNSDQNLGVQPVTSSL